MLTNLSNVRLFAYVFCFNPATGEISEIPSFCLFAGLAHVLFVVLWYSARQGAGDVNDPDAAASLDTALEPGQVLGAGFGNGGVQPLMFAMPEHQSIDVSLFKVFVTATPTDMTSLEQPSAFDNDARRHAIWTTPRDVGYDFWMTKTITVVEKAKMDANL
ncbi:hypothetical protein CPB85DRAFT_391675 [Mucidula mucida]|nr:hypothetical protein CPB85DRAFT_391675 [Mucidula mucida]